MKLALSGDRLILAHHNGSLALELDDLRSLRTLNPYGRKIHFGRKAKLRLSARPDDPEALLLLTWSALPVREWNFPVEAPAGS